MKKKIKRHLSTIMFVSILIIFSLYPLIERYIFKTKGNEEISEIEQDQIIKKRTNLLVKGKIQRLEKKWGRRLDYMIVLSSKALKYHQWIDDESSHSQDDEYDSLISCGKVKDKNMMTMCFRDIYKKKNNINLANSFKHLMTESLKLILETEEAISVVLENRDGEVIDGFKRNSSGTIKRTINLYRPADSQMIKKEIKENGVKVGMIKFVYTYKSLESTTNEIEQILRMNLK